MTSVAAAVSSVSPRLRFAPSPTGYLHVGGARTALFNFLYARAHNGVFILRIEDTDRERSDPAATAQVLAALRWLGIHWDEGPADSAAADDGGRGGYGPYFQSARLAIYQQHYDRLLAEEKAYLCFCSTQELAAKRKLSESMGKPYVYDGKCRRLSTAERTTMLRTNMPHTVRFKTSEQELSFHDTVKGNVRFLTKLIGDFVIRKADGFPTYNFAVVVDDALMKISHVLRGDDHISNTPRQLLLYQAFGYTPPQFAHVAMILGSKREKLSKRDGVTSVLEFQTNGYYSDPLVNHLALLGWSPADGKELLTRKELLSAFQTLKFSSAPAVFDYGKLDYFNAQYLRSLPAETIVRDFKAVLAKSSVGKQYLTHPKLSELLLALRDYCKKLTDIVEELTKLLAPAAELDAEERSWIESNEARKLFALAVERLAAPRPNADTVPVYVEHEEWLAFKSEAKQALKLSGKAFFMPLRVQLTRRTRGIELDKYFQLIERKTILERLNVAV